MSGQTVMSTPLDSLGQVTAHPALAALRARIAPLALELRPASTNPDPAHRDCFDTWGEPDRLVLGVPADADAPRVLEALWQAVLLAEGWPEPAAVADPWEGELAAGLLRATSRSRLRSAGLDVTELVGPELAGMIRRLGPEADPRDVIRAWFALSPLGEAERAQALDRIAQRDPELAAEATEFLACLPGTPLDGAQARRTYAWMAGLGL